MIDDLNLLGFKIKLDPDLAPNTFAFENVCGQRQIIHLSEWPINEDHIYDDKD